MSVAATVDAAPNIRIPFSTAVSHPKLLGPRFAELSFVQQIILKAAYGCALSDSAKDALGWSELDYFWAMQGYGEFDSLGFLVRVDRAAAPSVYVPQEYQEVILNQGVRSGKSTIASFVVSYESTCGGHEARVRKGRRLITFQVAQDLNQAKYALNDILANLEMMPWMKGRFDATKERIDLWNGVTTMTVPPTVKSVRGYDSPAAVLDEIAVWYQDSDSANPDFEIYNQVRSRQAQFLTPKIWLISSPWNEGGLLYDRIKAGTNGRWVACEFHADGPRPMECMECAKEQKPHHGRLALTMPTAAMGNPLVTLQWLESYRASNPRAFERECLARFQKSVSGFLDTDVVEAAIAKGVRERLPERGVQYVIAVDPAFRRDIFAVAVAHTDNKGRVVYDRIERWRRKQGEAPLNVETCLDKLKEIAQLYGVSALVTDQHQYESLKVLCSQRGLGLIEFNFQSSSKAEIYSNLQALFNQRKMVLLDRSDVVDELLRLERTLTGGGSVQIEAPRGYTDDLATVTALAARHAIWLAPLGIALTEDEKTLAPYMQAEATLSVHEQIQAQINRRHIIEGSDWD